MSKPVAELVVSLLIMVVFVVLVLTAAISGVVAGRTAASVREAHISAGHIQCVIQDRVVWTLPEICDEQR